MKQKIDYIYITISGVVSVLLCILLIYKLNTCINFTETLISTRESILTISGLLSGIIMAYLTSRVLQIREERISKLPQINELTQKIHKFRRIVNKLLSTDLLPREARDIIDSKYKGLTFYDYQDCLTQQAINYSEDKNCGGLTSLYLELRAFDSKERTFDKTVYSEFEVSKFYNTQTLIKWMNYDCGNGLWYYFDNEYADYKNSFNFNIYNGDKDEILESCLLIDRERYYGMAFDAQLLAKLGTQIHSEIIPKLFKVQLSVEKNLPKIVNYLFSIFVLLVIFGVMIPLLSNLLSSCLIWDIIAISATTGICVYIILSFYGFMEKEIKQER